jgi:hypothetical protein
MKLLNNFKLKIYNIKKIQISKKLNEKKKKIQINNT